MPEAGWLTRGHLVESPRFVYYESCKMPLEGGLIWANCISLSRPVNSLSIFLRNGFLNSSSKIGLTTIQRVPKSLLMRNGPGDRLGGTSDQAAERIQSAMLKAILWDNDGVLVDTEGLYFQASRDGFRRSEWPTMVEEGSDQSLS
jgi:hypothetical protein